MRAASTTKEYYGSVENRLEESKPTRQQSTVKGILEVATLLAAGKYETTPKTKITMEMATAVGLMLVTMMTKSADMQLWKGHITYEQ